MTSPDVSVLLPAWNEVELLSRCLDSLLAIHTIDIEVVLCVGGSDGTVEVAQQYAGANPQRVTMLEQHAGEGKQVSLRRCLRRAQGTFIFLTDADCVISEHVLRRFIA